MFGTTVSVALMTQFLVSLIFSLHAVTTQPPLSPEPPRGRSARSAGLSEGGHILGEHRAVCKVLVSDTTATVT